MCTYERMWVIHCSDINIHIHVLYHKHTIFQELDFQEVIISSSKILFALREFFGGWGKPRVFNLASIQYSLLLCLQLA